MTSVTTTINNAQKAIAIGNSLAGNSAAANNPPQTQTSTWKNMHWSVYVVAVGGVVALAAGIAMAILANYPMTAVCGVILVIEIIGAYYLKEGAPYRSLAAIADQFFDIVNKINQNQKQIQLSNQQMQKTNQELQKTNQQLKQVVEQGNTNLKNADAVIKDLKETSTQNAKALTTADANLQNELAQTKDKLAQMTLLYNSVQSEISQLKTTVQQYTDTQNLIAKDTAELAQRSPKSCAEIAKRRESIIAKGNKLQADLKGGLDKLDSIFGDKQSNPMQAFMSLSQNEAQFADSVNKVAQAEAGLEGVSKDIEKAVADRKAQSKELSNLLAALQKATANAK